MSKNLYWRVAPPSPDPIGSAYFPLKEIIANFYFLGNYSCASKKILVDTQDASLINYLEGFKDAMADTREGKDEIEDFLRDLRQHGWLEVWIDD